MIVNCKLQRGTSAVLFNSEGLRNLRSVFRLIEKFPRMKLHCSVVALRISLHVSLQFLVFYSVKKHINYQNGKSLMLYEVLVF